MHIPADWQSESVDVDCAVLGCVVSVVSVDSAVAVAVAVSWIVLCVIKSSLLLKTLNTLPELSSPKVNNE